MFVLVHSNFDYIQTYRQTDKVFFSRPVVEVSLRDDLITCITTFAFMGFPIPAKDDYTHVLAVKQTFSSRPVLLPAL